MKRRIVPILIVALCVAILPAGGAPAIASAAPHAAGLAASAWPMLGHDPTHSFTSSVAGPATPLKKWESPLGQLYSPYTASPVIGADGTIYIATYSRLYAINPDGTQKWHWVSKDGLYGSPAIDSTGTVYLGGTSGELYAVNPDGTLKWKFDTGLAVVASPVIGTDGTIYVGAEDGHFYAINPDGTKKWDYLTAGAIASSAAIDTTGTIYFGSGDGKFHALNPDGSQKWVFAAAGSAQGAPILGSDGSVYFAATDGYFYALNSAGALRWEAIAGSGYYGYYPGPYYYLGTAAGAVSALATATPSMLLVPNKGGTKLLSLSAAGALNWSFAATDTEFYNVMPPAIDSNGVAYTGSLGTGRLFAINPDGTEKWHATPEPPVYYDYYYPVSSPVIGADGTLYLTARGELVAIGGSATSVSIQASRSTIFLHKSVAFSGSVTPGVAGDRFAVDVMLPGSRSWTYLSTRLASSVIGGHANWSYSYTPRKRGAYHFRVRFLGDATGAMSVSSSVRVRVQ